MKLLIGALSFFTLITLGDIIMTSLYCDAGFMDQPDKWKTPQLERLHYILAPVGTIGIIVCLAILCIIK